MLDFKVFDGLSTCWLQLSMLSLSSLLLFDYHVVLLRVKSCHSYRLYHSLSLSLSLSLGVHMNIGYICISFSSNVDCFEFFLNCSPFPLIYDDKDFYSTIVIRTLHSFIGNYLLNN